MTTAGFVVGGAGGCDDENAGSGCGVVELHEAVASIIAIVASCFFKGVTPGEKAKERSIRTAPASSSLIGRTRRTYPLRMPILGHGIDIVETVRVKRLVDEHGQRFLDRVYTV